MTTVADIKNFMGSLPEDALAVLVVQRGRRPFVLRTDTLTLGKKLEAEKFPNWPRAVWEGLSQGTGSLPPDPSDDVIGGGVGEHGA